METEQSHQNGLNTSEPMQHKPNSNGLTPLTAPNTAYTSLPINTPFTDKPLDSPIFSPPDKAFSDFVGTLNIDPAIDLSTDIPSDIQNDIVEKIANEIASQIANMPHTIDTTNNTPNNVPATTNNKAPNETDSDTASTNSASTATSPDTSLTQESAPNNTTTSEVTKTKGKKKKEKKISTPSSGKRGRKPAQDPPYTKLYKQPWLDGWATCKRLALEYIEETKLIAEKSNLPVGEVRRLPSQSDLTSGNSKRVWTPMELILARAFLKEADLVNTSTKRGATIRGEILIDQLPELISNTVLPSTHAVHYNPKQRSKDPNEPKKEKKQKAPKKQKIDKTDKTEKPEPPQDPPQNPPKDSPPLIAGSPIFQPKDPIPFFKSAVQ